MNFNSTIKNKKKTKIDFPVQSEGKNKTKCESWLEEEANEIKKREKLFFCLYWLSTFPRSYFLSFFSLWRIKCQIEWITQTHMLILHFLLVWVKWVSFFWEPSENACTFDSKSCRVEGDSPQFLTTMEGIVLSVIWVFHMMFFTRLFPIHVLNCLVRI